MELNNDKAALCPQFCEEFEMNANEIIPLIGLTADDQKVKDFLVACGMKKKPRLKKGEESAYLTNEKQGIEITFGDERELELQGYEEGALVLWNVRMYGEDDDFEQ